jgi:hypothetical protein
MEHEDHLDINFIYVKRNLHSLEDLLDHYTELIMDCKNADETKDTIHMLIGDLYGIVEADIMFNDILDKVKYLNKTHIVTDID